MIHACVDQFKKTVLNAYLAYASKKALEGYVSMKSLCNLVGNTV
jgi:hypothetical protein